MTRTVRIPPAAAAIAVVFTLAYAVHALVRHWSFGSSGFDLGIFDQAIWHLSRFERPASTVGGYANIFGDHFHPILLLLVPLYSAWPAAETLLVAQAALLGASTIPVFLYARLRVGDRAASAFAIAYGLFWGMQKAAAFDFHEIAFAPLLIGTAILAVETGRLRLFWAAAVALCLVKEDLIPVVAMFALRLAVLGHIRHAAAAAAVALFGFAAVMQFVIPWVKGNDVYAYQSVYGGLSLWNAPARLFTPPGKMMTVVMWLAPFAFLPLRSPLLLLALPLALARLLSNNPNHWGTAFHYGAPLAPILATAAADGISRIRALAAENGLRPALIAVMIVFSATLPGRLPLWRLFSPTQYAHVAAARTGYEALAVIPPDASVTAQDAIVPHLTRRAHVYTLGNNPPRTEYVIAAAPLRPWPLPDVQAVSAILEQHRADGYRVVFSRDGWIVLQRPLSAYARRLYEVSRLASAVR